MLMESGTELPRLANCWVLNAIIDALYVSKLLLGDKNIFHDQILEIRAKEHIQCISG